MLKNFAYLNLTYARFLSIRVVLFVKLRMALTIDIAPITQLRMCVMKKSTHIREVTQGG